MIKMISLILGGGAGSRLYPLTSERSKPAVPIGGKYRLIDIPISNCLNSGVRRMFVLTQFNSASLNQHIQNTYHFDMFSHGFVNILAAEQTPSSDNWFQGTADAVRQSMHHLRNHDHDYILVLSGDQLYQMDFELLAKYHIEKDADLTIATIPVVAEDAPGFGIMKVNAEGRIEDFTEKPGPDLLPDWKSVVPEKYSSAGKHYLASMGIYIFKKAFLEKLFADQPDATDFGKEIIPSAIEGGYKIASYAFDEYWSDIGTIRSFFDANIALTDNIPDFNLFDNDKQVFTRPRLLAPAKVFGTWFNKAIIAEGCIIHAKKIERSVIGIRSRIGEGTEISESIIMGNDYYETMEEMESVQQPMGIGEDCEIHRAIVDKNCRVGDKVVIIGNTELEDVETDTYVIRDGIIVLKKGAHIPDGTVIGKP
ncbi:glucose-1-phosphate adenylyltransferase [Phaeodactylibacter luteus]|uniref:Glucose-1-phosphate adenylyltransferase n=1 Tax=Phaeodactylibacter luteus TaxID=1564516 RepID=A0A5C6RJ52_9BACT|nr:glucose-1-phosphate adenylyltransferase [Phaeodactylibacter luteus]TXB62456.1 glucose-1-phosphate adenylyltransferase [Phaeodactylibacter luteus]